VVADTIALPPDVVGELVVAARPILAGADPQQLVADLVEAGIEQYVAADPAVAGALFAVQGAELGRSTLLDLVLAGAEYRPGTRVVLPMPGERRPPGTTRDDDVVVDGIVDVPESAQDLIVHTAGAAVRVPVTELSVVPARGFDPGLGLAVVRGTVHRNDAEPVAAPVWEVVADRAAVMVAHELVGVGGRALAVAVTHVAERMQFGRPLAALQSVRHRLATVHVELEAARALLASHDEFDEIAALAVKAAAGGAALGAVAAAQQVCGAMGFTAEHGLHASVRRAAVLDSLFGSAADLEIEIGALLAARGCLPPPVPLVASGAEAGHA